MTTLASRVAQFEQDVELVHDIVHGPASGAGSIVTTDGGQLKTLAKLLADADQEVTESVGLRTDLAAPSGASHVGYAPDGSVEAALAVRVPEIGTYALLRAYTGALVAFYVRGVANLFDGGAGVFRVDASDTTSADNGGTILVDALGRRWGREFTGTANMQWFGPVGDGSSNDTAAVLAAFTWLNGAPYRTLEGASGRAYKVTNTIEITQQNVEFDGCNCTFYNAAAGKAPLFKLVEANASYAWLHNFKVFGGGASQGHVIAIFGGVNNPQGIKIERVSVTGNTGTGLDKLGADVPACFIWMQGGSDLTVRDCSTYVTGGGIYIQDSEKILLSNVVLDNCNAGRTLLVKNTRSVAITDRCIFNGGDTGDQVEINGCIKASITECRFKGGTANNLYAVSNVGFDVVGNHFEVYSADSTVLIDGSNNLVCVEKNTFQVIGGIAVAQAIIDVAGTTLNLGGRIAGNVITLGNLASVNVGIRLSGASAAIRGWAIESNVIGNAATGATVTTGIELSGVGSSLGHRVENNVLGMSGAGSAMTTGIKLTSVVIGAIIGGNLQNGTVTTFLDDASVKPMRFDAGYLKNGAFTPVVYGGTVAGTAAYSIQAGRYVQIGNLVYISIYVAWTGHTGTGDLRISGLPFPFAATANEVQPLTVMGSNLTFTGQLAAYSSGNAAFLRIAQFASGGALAFTPMDAAGDLIISGWYEIA